MRVSHVWARKWKKTADLSTALLSKAARSANLREVALICSDTFDLWQRENFWLEQFIVRELDYIPTVLGMQMGPPNARMWHAQVPIRLYTLYSWCYSQLEDPIMGPTTLDQEEFACHWKKAYEAYIAGNWPVSTVSLSTSSTVSLFIINRVSEPTTVTYFL